MGMAMMGPQATGGFQAPEPYVPESAKAAGALYETGVAPSVIEAAISHPASTYNNPPLATHTADYSNFNEAIGGASLGPLPQATTIPIPKGGFSYPSPTAAEPAPFDPVAYRNQFKPDSGGLASVAQPAPIELVNLTGAVPTIPQPKGYETGGPTVEFLPQRGGPASRGQQMPSFFQQPMPMMPQPFNPMGYGPMGMGMGMNRFMNPYGGLGGISYNFMNRPMPLYGQGGQFTAGQYQAPEPKTTAAMTAGMLGSFMPYY